MLIDDVYSGGKASDGDYMLLSEAMKRGLYHPRCRHGCSTYFPELDDINTEYGNDYSDTNIYGDEETQKAHTENMVQKYKRLAQGSIDPENVEKYREKVEEWEQQLSGFIDKSVESDIIRTKEVSSRNLPNGLRNQPGYILTENEIEQLKNDIFEIGADVKVFKFNVGRRTGYDDFLDEIRVRGDILPDEESNHPRDKMSARAALAHEYYGHRAYRGTSLPYGAWNDEFRASYMAAKNCPNLSDADRYYLILDALERAKESGVSIRYNNFIRSILYGY